MEFKAQANLNWTKPMVDIENGVAIMLRQMMEDTHRFSLPITPKRVDPIGGSLRASVTKQMVSNDKGVMRWAMNYAAVQEQGGRTDPRTGKYIVFQNYSTPGTHAHFISESVQKVMNNLPYYLEIGGLTQ